MHGSAELILITRVAPVLCSTTAQVTPGGSPKPRKASKTEEARRTFYKPSGTASKLPWRGPLWIGPLVIARVSQVTLGGEQVRLSLSHSSSATRRSCYISASSIWGVFTGDKGPLLKNPARGDSQHTHAHAHTQFLLLSLRFVLSHTPLLRNHLD